MQSIFHHFSIASVAAMNEEDYLKGYEAGLKEAWKEVVRLISRGARSRELQMIVKSKIATIYQTLDAKRHRLKEMREGEDIQTTIRKAERQQYEQHKQKPGKQEQQEKQMDTDLLSKGAFLIKEEEPKLAFELLAKMVKQGRKGLCILRTYPEEIMDRFELKGVSMIWLTKTETITPIMTPASLALGIGDTDTLPPLEYDRTSPTNLQDLSGKIIGFMKSNNGGIVLLERVDFLISQNDFDRVLRFLQFIRDKSLDNNTAFLISINPKTINEIEYNLLKSEVKRVL